jgi:hypothetical protein
MKVRFHLMGGAHDGIFASTHAEDFYRQTNQGTVGQQFWAANLCAGNWFDRGLPTEQTLVVHRYEVTERVEEPEGILVKAKFLGAT